MVTNQIVQLRPNQSTITGPTYGATTMSDVTAFEALADEIKRTNAHVLWLEAYVAQLPEWSVFESIEFSWEQENEYARAGKPFPAPGTIKWLMEMERAKKHNKGQRRPSVHPAIKQLMVERQHLLNCCSAAMRIGISMESIELAKKHGAVLLEAMNKFAHQLGHDANDPQIAQLIADAWSAAQTMAAEANANNGG